MTAIFGVSAHSDGAIHPSHTRKVTGLCAIRYIENIRCSANEASAVMDKLNLQRSLLDDLVSKGTMDGVDSLQ